MLLFAVRVPDDRPEWIERLWLQQEGCQGKRAADPDILSPDVDVRAMLERATQFEPSVVEGRFTIHVVHKRRPWIVIVEPDVDATLLVVVTPYEVSE